MQQDITQHITLELNKPVDKAKICVKKNDTNSRRVQVTLTNNGGLVQLDEAVKAVIKGRKPDNNIFYNDCSIVGDTIWYAVTSQMINVAGSVECEIEIAWLDESLITTPKFYLEVYETQNPGVESQNEYTALTQMVAECTNERLAAQAAKTAAETAQAGAETAQGLAEDAQSAAEAAQTAAEAAQSASENAQSESELARDNALAAKTAAETAQTAAEVARTAAQTAQTGAETAETNAVTAKNAAASSQTAAELAETGATNAKTAAQSAQSVAVNAKDIAIQAKDAAVAAETVTLEAKDYVVQYVQDFIDDQEEHNQTLILAERYTDSKTEPLEDAIGDMDDLEVQAVDLVGACNTLNTALKGKQLAESFNSYSAMVTALNAAASTAYKVGQSLYIVTLEVPDMWISSIEQSAVTYTYVNDSTLLSDLATAGGSLQIGYFKISILETQKVDLSSINSDIATLQSGLATANSNISTLQSGLTTANSNISTLQSDMTTANTNIGTLQTDVGVNTSAISALQTALATANSNITDLQARLGYPT